MKRISIIGSTGSIGRSALQVIAALPGEFEVVGLAARKSVDIIEQQVYQFHPRQVALADEQAAQILRKRLKAQTDVEVLSGMEGVIQIATEESDMVLSAAVGSAGLLPTLKAIHAGKDIAFANKEVLVMGGALVMKAVEEHRVNLLPVDSEISAIFQCLEGNRRPEDIKKLVLTASGGPFRQLPISEFATITPERALQHPNWSMGAKITIDSATMMNKGFEVIEAKWLFDVELSQIEVIVHPESIIHSMVEFADGSWMAQLSVPDMRIPIQYALTYPHRIPNSWDGAVHPDKDGTQLNLANIGALTFEPLDLDKFPCLRLALRAAQIGGTMPTVLSAADEIVVQAFLDGKIGFLDIHKIIERVMSIRAERSDICAKPSRESGQRSGEFKLCPSLDDILAADTWAKQVTETLI